MLFWLYWVMFLGWVVGLWWFSWFKVCWLIGLEVIWVAILCLLGLISD